MKVVIAIVWIILTIMCESIVSAQSPIQNINHQTIVSVTVNGSGPYPFLLNTGAQDMLIDPALAVGWHLTDAGKNRDVYGIGGERKTVRTVIAAFTLAGQTLNMQAVVYAVPVPNRGYTPVYGIIGQAFLEHFIVTIDYVHSTLTLTTAPVAVASN